MKKGVTYEVQEEPIILSKYLMDTLLSQENPALLISLYCFYYYTAKWQKTNQLKATTDYVANGLNLTQRVVRANKAILLDLGLIEDVTEKNSDGKILGHYIKLNFIWTRQKASEYTEEIKTTESTLANSHRVVICKSNALSSNNLNALSPVIDEEDTRGKTLFPETSIKIIPKQFEIFWSLYPKKDGKGAALTAWNKLCQKKVRPTWIEMRKSLKSQIKSERWQQEKQFIPMASTWLNQSRWLDDPELLVVYRRTTPIQKSKEDTDYSYTETPLPDHILKQQRANERKAANR